MELRTHTTLSGQLNPDFRPLLLTANVKLGPPLRAPVVSSFKLGPLSGIQCSVWAIQMLSGHSLCRNGCEFRQKGPRLALATKGEKITSLTLPNIHFHSLTSAVAQNKRTMGRVAPHGSHLHAKGLAHAEQQGPARPNTVAGSSASADDVRTQH